MEPSNTKSTKSIPSVWPQVPPSLLLSAVMLPVLAGLVGGRLTLKGLQNLGEASEEVFRGERLPLLKFPKSSASSSDQT